MIHHFTYEATFEAPEGTIHTNVLTIASTWKGGLAAQAGAVRDETVRELFAVSMKRLGTKLLSLQRIEQAQIELCDPDCSALADEDDLAQASASGLAMAAAMN